MRGQRDKAPHAPWPMVRLGDVCEEIKDRIQSSKVAVSEYVTTDNMVKDRGGIVQAEYVPSDVGLVEYRKGDVLIANIRPYLKKIWLADHDGGCSSDVVVFRTNTDELSPEYLYSVLSQDAYFEYVMQKPRGTKMPRGDRDWMKEFRFPLPPLPVQREIVARLERELAAVEKMKKGFEEMAATADAAFKAELKEVFEGLRCSGVEMRRLEDVCELKAGGDKPTVFSKCVIDTMRIPVVSNGIQNDGICGYTNVATEHAGCVTVSARGTIGWSCVRDYSFVPIVRLIVVRPKDKVDVGYLLRMLQQLSFNQSGSSIPQLTVPMLKGVEIPLPSLPIQRQIVDRLSAAKARAEKMEAKAREGVAVCETMRKAILKEAFE